MSKSDIEKCSLDVTAGPLGYCKSTDLEFSIDSYRVPLRKGGKVEILKDISGACRSHRFLALMGASGAGKTSLIDILSRHIRAGVVGKMTINGQPFKAAEFQKQCCYVLQRDILLATATVEESVTTSALLRLPQSMSREEKKQRVSNIIQQLDLGKCADTLVGDDAQCIKGISGGERRRLSVAIGLITDPQIILLDEPTSGLDSEMASQLISCLVQLVRANRTVVASIHQPNYQITDCFDDLLLLTNGRCIYNGSWKSSVPYFASAGYECPLYTNPSDYYLTISQGAAADLVTKWADRSEQWLRFSKDPTWAAPEYLSSTDLSVPEPATNWPFQVRVLFVRFVRTWYRNPYLFFSFLAQYIFSSIFIGLMYIQLGTSRASSIFDRQASLFLVLIMLAFTPSNTACTVWETERLLLRREANSGAYKLSTFFAAKTLVTMPMQAFVTFLFCVLFYFIVGYQLVAAKFFIFLGTCILFQFISETLGCLCAVATQTTTIGILLSSTLLMVLVAFSGFLINHTPVFFRWIPKISFVTYAYSILYQNELDGLQMNLMGHGSSMLSGSGLKISLANSEFQCLPTGSQSSSRGPAGNDMTISQNAGVLVAILIGLRLITYILLAAAFKLKRL